MNSQQQTNTLEKNAAENYFVWLVHAEKRTGNVQGTWANKLEFHLMRKEAQRCTLFTKRDIKKKNTCAI